MLAEGTHHMMLEQEPHGAVPRRAGVPRRRHRVSCEHDSSPRFHRRPARCRAGLAPRTRNARCNSRRSQAVTAQHGMVVAQESRAARIGAEVLQARRQRRRCRGRGRLRHGGDLSARRQHRRRRLHGDPSRQAGKRDIAIDYRETAPAATTKDTFLNARGRGRSGQIARPGPRHRRARHRRRTDAWRWRNTAPANSSCRSSSRRRSSSPATATRSATSSRTPAARRSRGWRAGRRPRSCSSSPTAR